MNNCEILPAIYLSQSSKLGDLWNNAFHYSILTEYPNWKTAQNLKVATDYKLRLIF